MLDTRLGERTLSIRDPAMPCARPQRTPLPVLTSLRFLAAAYVLIFHYNRFFFPEEPSGALIELGHTGVTFFFLLSGFILAYTYETADFGNRLVRSRYLLARFARIYPLFLFSLAISLPWFAVWVLKTEPPLKWLIGSGAILAPLGLHAWLPGAACSLNCASWSISTEAFFYLLFPFLLPVVLRRPKVSAIAAFGLWFVASLLATALWSHVAPGVSLIDPEQAGTGALLWGQAIKYNPLLRLPEFVGGLVLFAWWRRARAAGSDWQEPSRAGAFLAVAALAAIALVLAEPAVPAVFMHNGLSALAWAPLILAGAEWRGGVLASAPAVFLGRISFALYLLHLPAYAIVRTLDKAARDATISHSPWMTYGAAVVLALALSCLAHLLIEEPARRMLLRRGLKLPKLVPPTVEPEMVIPSVPMGIPPVRAVAGTAIAPE